jgi:alpha-L-fucosidase
VAALLAWWLVPASLLPGGTPRLAVPTREQIEWHSLEIGAMICLGPQTWQGKEYDDLSTPLSVINPSSLDAEKWVETVRAMNARYVVFVAKHTGGFCFWPTKTTDYHIGKTPLRGGGVDAVAELAQACRRQGVGFGVYLSPQDAQFGAGVGGRCATPSKQQQYEQVFRRQLTELLTGYGPVMEVWFDGSLVFDVGDLLRKYAPCAMIFQGPQATIRWTGNEQGYTTYPLWNPVARDRAVSGVSVSRDGRPDGDVWLPVECDVPTRQGWFWRPGNAATLKSLREYQAMYYESVGRGANLLLNLTPDTSGAIPADETASAREFGDWVRSSFRTPIASARNSGGQATLTWSKPRPVNHAVLMENIARGQRILQYEIEALSDGKWLKVGGGKTIGYKRIERFREVTASGLRVGVVQSLDTPELSRFEAFHLAGASTQAAKDAAIEISLPLDRVQTGGDLCRSGAVLDLTTHVHSAGLWRLTLWDRKLRRPVPVRSAVLVQGDTKISEGTRILADGTAVSFTVNGLQDRVMLDLQVREAASCENLLVKLGPAQ